MAARTYEDFDYEDLCTYAGVDTEVTLNLLRALMPSLLREPKYSVREDGIQSFVKAPSIWSELVDVKTLALEFTCDLKITGMYYDQDANREMKTQMALELHTLKESIFAAIGKEIPLSGDGLGRFLYQEKRLKCPVKTAHGEDSTSGDALKELHEQYKLPWLLDIKRFVDVRSMYNNFVDVYIDKYVKSDSRIHCDYNLQGTSSHRISSTNPRMLGL